jgi:hypothetical protein
MQLKLNSPPLCRSICGLVIYRKNNIHTMVYLMNNESYLHLGGIGH